MWVDERGLDSIGESFANNTDYAFLKYNENDLSEVTACHRKAGTIYAFDVIPEKGDADKSSGRKEKKATP